MKTIEEYKKLLWEKYLSSKHPDIEDRYLHSLGVSKKAIELIDTFSLNVDKEKAEIAGLLHDYAKFENMDKYRMIVEEYKLDDNYLKISPNILHAFLGPYIIQKELGVNDLEILDAIRYHATGNINMSLLAEVIYLADFTDETRTGPYFEDVKILSKIDFKKAILNKIEKRLQKVSNDEISIKMYQKYKED